MSRRSASSPPCARPAWRRFRPLRWAADQIHCAVGKLLQICARHAGARSDRQAVENCARNLGKLGRIGGGRQFSTFHGEPQARLEGRVDIAKCDTEISPYLRVMHRLGSSGPDQETSSRAACRRKVNIQRLGIDRPQCRANRAIRRQCSGHGVPPRRPIMLERLYVDRMLVAKCAVEARAVHAGRSGKVVKRRSGEAGRPERLDGLRQSDVRHICRRAPASFWFFLYHFAKKIR